MITNNFDFHQGTWQSPGGRCVNYIVLKENLENHIDITKVELKQKPFFFILKIMHLLKWKSQIYFSESLETLSAFESQSWFSY
jgi:hypothetical protein